MSAADESKVAERPLTPEDPVGAAVLEQLQHLQDARLEMGDRLLTLEQDRIQILGAVRKIDDQRNRLFESCLIDRGLPPTARAQIDGKTGKIFVESEPQVKKSKKD
jgi:chromosome segregation ATPase